MNPVIFLAIKAILYSPIPASQFHGSSPLTYEGEHKKKMCVWNVFSSTLDIGPGFASKLSVMWDVTNHAHSPVSDLWGAQRKTSTLCKIKQPSIVKLHTHHFTQWRSKHSAAGTRRKSQNKASGPVGHCNRRFFTTSWLNRPKDSWIN